MNDTKRIISIVFCFALIVLLCGCSFDLPHIPAEKSPTNSSETIDEQKDSLLESGKNPKDAETKEESKKMAQEFADILNEEFANMSDEERKEAGFEGIKMKCLIRDDSVFVIQVQIEGFAGTVYSASTGDKDALAVYDEILITNRDELANWKEDFGQSFEDFNIKELELWIMNDINPDNVLVILKNGQVVYDVVYGINLIDLGSSSN